MPGAPTPTVLPVKEKYSFGFALLGQNLIFGLFFNYLLIFYTDVYGISAAAVGTLFLVARTWDAINDPLMGIIVDRTRTRWGKFRPYLLWTPLPIAIATVLCFTAFDVQPTTKLILAYTTYIVWSMIYTVNDVPIWALSSAMTQDSEARTSLITLARLLSLVGIMIPAIFVIPMVEYFGQGNDAVGYQSTAMVLAAAACGLMLLAFFNVNERVTPKTERPNLGQSYRALASNRPLQIIVLLSLLSVLGLVGQSLFVYFATYNLGDRGLLPTLFAVTAVGMIVGILPIPMLVRRMGKKQTMAALIVVNAMAAVVFFAVGYENLTLVYVLTAINSLPTGARTVLTTAMIADTIEYMQWRTGERSEGIIFSVQTFTAKITTAIGGFVGGVALTVIGYQPNATQSPDTLLWIFALVTLIPGVVGLLALWPLYFYELTEERYQAILTEIRAMEESA
ncbi:MAG: MFS transporter [Pseudomonadota bacterium]